MTNTTAEVTGLDWWLEDYEFVNEETGEKSQTEGFKVVAYIGDETHVVIADAVDSVKHVVGMIYWWAEKTGIPTETIEQVFEKQRAAASKVPPGHGYELIVNEDW